MNGECETCAKRETCTKDIGILFGFCYHDYEPMEHEQEEHA